MTACPILFSNTAEWLKITVLSFNTFCLFRFSSDFVASGVVIINVQSFLVVKLLVVLVSLDVNLSFPVINASVIFRLINMDYLELIS